MSHVVAGFTRALEVPAAAAELVEAVESALSPGTSPVGGLVLATAAAGTQGFEVGQRLADRWPEATLAGTGFEGLLAEGRVWRDEPAIAVLAWPESGLGTPHALVIEAGALVGDEEALAHLELMLHSVAGDRDPGAGDLVVMFPDVLSGSRLEAGLGRLARVGVGPSGGPVLAGAAASGLAGRPCAAWMEGEAEPGATLALFVPGVSGDAAGRLAQAGGSRAASPWLEVSACRGGWLDRLEDESAVDWIRRQLGLESDESIEPWLDRLLVRVRDAGGPITGASHATGESDASDLDFVERYVVGVAKDRGAISLAAPVAKGDRVAFALPDAERARVDLRAAVAALPGSSLLLQLACRARDASLHGDADLESALVASEARGRTVLGTVGPFEIAPDSAGRPRVQVHRTLLIGLGAS